MRQKKTLYDIAETLRGSSTFEMSIVGVTRSTALRVLLSRGQGFPQSKG